jgi:hypothetical protein
MNCHHPKTNTQMLLYFYQELPASQMDFYGYNLNNSYNKLGLIYFYANQNLKLNLHKLTKTLQFK